jgi:predicted esterase
VLLAGTIVDEADWMAALTTPGRVAGLPVMMWHAHADEVLRIETAMRLRDRLRDAGADVQWSEQAGGHAPSVEAEAAARAFVVAQLSRSA